MIVSQIFIQTLWASILVLGWIKFFLIVVAIAILARVQPWLGVLAVIVFIAYLAHWIH